MSAATPWWASDDGVADIDAHEDPFDAHWTSRAADVPDAPDWMRLVGDVAVGAVRRFGALAEDARRSDHGHSSSSDDAACRNCPVCMVLRAADRSGSDVSEHLADAARHLALAAASFLEALAEQPDRSAQSAVGQDASEVNVDDPMREPGP